MNMQKISAIFEKDLKDFSKNIMLLMLPAIPILLALMYMRIGDGDTALPIEVIYVLIGATFSTVTASMMMTMIAEENEKKTLRGLIQSPTSMLDIIVGKSLVVGLVSLLTLVISLLIIGIEPFLNIKAILELILLFLFFLLLGIGVGLFSNSMAATSAYLMPIMLLFGFTPMIQGLGFSEDHIVYKVVEFFPVVQGMRSHDTSSWLSIGIITIWTLAAAIFMYICFRKTMTDD